jgi:SAM-dependent methyltransferase
MADNQMLYWETGYASLILNDFYTLLNLPPSAKGDMLDAGCGAGRDSGHWHILAPNLNIVGVDLVPNQVRQAAARNASLRFAVASVEALPFPNGSFDYLASLEVLEHTETPENALAEYFRVLRPGGLAVLATPNGASLWSVHIKQRILRLQGKRGAPVGDDHTRPAGFWRRAVTAAGFVIEREFYDGVALDFQMFMAPPFVMKYFRRLLEPLRVVPGVRLLVADRVKFRVRKPHA